MSERDLDAEFERIIAGWDDEAPDPRPRDGAPDTADTADDLGPDRDGDPAAENVGESATVADDGAGTVSPDLAAHPAVDAADAVEHVPERPSDRAADPAAPPVQPGASGLLELPIAPTTSHAWRGGAPQRDDADEILDAVDPDSDHFVPPSEIDLPSAETDPMFWAIVGGLAGGPLLLLYVLFFDRDGSGWWVVTALTMVVVGFVLLVLRGGTERDPFDDGTRV
ncbi:hypothetical protein [Terrabacter sp. MAHUQ-38]|uniref:hypothetical protein n=1 Tax=unclassified Terrabacter TaxID=2630222 RepID=UPI00165DF238|nr:hypothetical protein [Terrabacter sp. MAHUQ-38]